MGHYSYVLVLVQRQRLADALRAIEQTDRRGSVPKLRTRVETLWTREDIWYPEVSVKPVVERDAEIDYLIANPNPVGSVPGPDGQFTTGTIQYAEALSSTQATLGMGLTVYPGESWVCLHFDPRWSMLNTAMHDSSALRTWFFAVAAAGGSSLVLYDHDCADTVDRVDPGGARTPVWRNDWTDKDESVAAWDKNVDALAEAAIRLGEA